MSELKPCPFCGSEAYSDKDTAQYFGNKSGWNYAIACSNCEAIAGVGRDTFEQAVADWNTRHIPEGYALVPVDPTQLMLERGQGTKGYTMDGYPNAHSLADKWKAMVKAAQEQNE